jgi:hypothetical protein
MRVRGWLLVLCAVLLVWQPLNFALTTAGLVDRLSTRGPELAIVILARLFSAALGIAAGLSLLQLKPVGVSLARTSLVVSAVVDVFDWATPYSPKNRPPGDATILLAAALMYYGLWFVYLIRSKRVRATYSL